VRSPSRFCSETPRSPSQAGHGPAAGRQQSAFFRQSRRVPVVELRLANGDFGVCPKRKKSSLGRFAATTVRQLWGDGKGSFRTNGKYSSATVRGTKWLVKDSCAGTLTRVARGSVTVRDRVRGKTVVVAAGKSYLAKP